MRLVDINKIKLNIEGEILSAIKVVPYMPKLHIVMANNNTASRIYVKRKVQLANKYKLETFIHEFESGDYEEIKNKIQELNNQEESLIMVQLPLFDELEKYRLEILDSIQPEKDVDVLTSKNLSRIKDLSSPRLPAVVKAIVSILDYQISDLSTKKVLVLNKSRLIGLPLQDYLRNKVARIDLFDEVTNYSVKDFDNYDALITATGKTEFLDLSQVQNGLLVIDVNSTKNKQGEIVGDVIQSSIEKKENITFTPVPGGVGPLTVLSLIHSVFEFSIKDESI